MTIIIIPHHQLPYGGEGCDCLNPMYVVRKFERCVFWVMEGREVVDREFTGLKVVDGRFMYMLY